MFWALQKRREELEKARREGFEEGRRLGRQAALEKLAAEMSDGDTEAENWFVRVIEAAQADTPQEPGSHRFGQGQAFAPAGIGSRQRSFGSGMPVTPNFLPNSIDWTVSTPLGNKTVAFVPDGKGRFKAILVDADPICLPQG